MGLSWEFGERDLGESEVGDCSRSGDTSGGLGIDSGLGEVLDWKHGIMGMRFPDGGLLRYRK